MSSGGEPGPPSASSSSRALPRSSFSCQSPFPFSTRCRSVIAATREPVVGRVVVRGDEEAGLDRLAAELGQLELLAARSFTSRSSVSRIAIRRV